MTKNIVVLAKIPLDTRESFLSLLGFKNAILTILEVPLNLLIVYYGVDLEILQCAHN